MPPRLCTACGALAVSRWSKYCAACREIGRQNQKAATSRANQLRWAEWRERGIDPTHGGEAAAKRGAAIRQSNVEKPRRRKDAQ